MQERRSHEDIGSGERWTGMKLQIGRNGIHLIPEGWVDEAYIEEVLGLKKEGDTVFCERKNGTGLSCIAYLQIRRQKNAPITLT